LRTAHGLFPEFDYPGHPEYYADIVYTAEARDNKGRIATRQFIAHYDFTPPILNCTNIVVTSPDGAGVPVEFGVTASSDGILQCTPASGSVFPVGTTTVTCIARDLCRNTNTCAFEVKVRGPNEDCVLNIALSQRTPPEVMLTWDCAATLQSAETLDGPWINVLGATTPHIAPAGGAHKFYRICLSGDCDGPPSGTRRFP
jgi:hypothetical protein